MRFIKNQKYRLCDICYKFQDVQGRWHYGMKADPEHKFISHHILHIDEIADSNIEDVGIFNYFISDMLPFKDTIDLEIEYDFWCSEFKSKNSKYWKGMNVCGWKFVTITPFMIRGADDRYENSYHPVTKGLAHIDTVEHIINGRGFLTMNLTPYANKTVIYLQVENENEDDKPFWLPEALTDNVNDYGFETEELLNEYLRIPRVYEYIHKVYSLKFGIYKGE